MNKLKTLYFRYSNSNRYINVLQNLVDTCNNSKNTLCALQMFDRFSYPQNIPTNFKKIYTQIIRKKKLVEKIDPRNFVSLIKSLIFVKENSHTESVAPYNT